MKLILYIRTFVVCFKNLFTKENVKQMLIGSLIGQLIGWAFVLGLFLGCTKSEDSNVPSAVATPVEEPAPVCTPLLELTTKLQSLLQRSDDLQIVINDLGSQIRSLVHAQSNVKNPVAYYHLELKILQLQEDQENAVFEQASIAFEMFDLRKEIKSYECK